MLHMVPKYVCIYGSKYEDDQIMTIQLNELQNIALTL